jgi:hypothetical protein
MLLSTYAFIILSDLNSQFNLNLKSILFGSHRDFMNFDALTLRQVNVKTFYCYSVVGILNSSKLLPFGGQDTENQ